MAVRVHARENPQIQWWVPYVDPMRNSNAPMAQRESPEPPPRWPDTIVDALSAIVRTSRVGEAVVASITRRTTVFDGGGGNITNPDALEAFEGRLLLPPDAYEQARSRGWAAVVYVHTRQRVRNERQLPLGLRFSLLHELVHAVNITQGAFRAWEQYREPCAADAARAFGPEEGFAWIVENMYRCEVSGIARAQYDNEYGLPPGVRPTPSNTVRALNAMEIESVAHARERAPLFARRLEALNVPYNPFRDANTRLPHPPICTP